MNIDAPSLIVSAVLPALIAIGLILIARRQASMLTLCCIFLLGGLASFVFTHFLNRALSPLEALVDGHSGSIRAAAASAFITAALSEELARLLTSICTFRALRNLAWIEMIFVCAMIGLGFAMFENAFCALTLTSALDVVVQRSIPTISHGAVALIMGSFLQRAVSADRRTSIRFFVLALLVPLILHGLYDFGAFLVEVIEIPEDVGDGGSVDIVPLGAMLAIMLLGLSVLLIELVWAGRIVFAARRVECPAQPFTRRKFER